MPIGNNSKAWLAAPVVDLMDALKASLPQMEGKKKGSQRATEAQHESRVHVMGGGEAPARKTAKKRARA
jgi:hypothetical protein